MKRFIIAAALAASLAGCAGTGTATDADRAVATVNAIWLPVRTLASLCAAGISKPCEDLNVRTNVAKAIPIADLAVAETIKAIRANPDVSNVEKWSRYAMSAIDILVKVLATYDVKQA